MVHSIYSSTHLSWGHANPFQTRTNQGHSPVRGLSEQEDATINDDPVRIARDHWVARPTYISDSSEIIDSIDVDMVDATQDDSVAEIYLILDTNILIHHLDVLKQALSLVGADPIRLNMVMLIPGIVVSELDYQKKSTRNIANESRKASDWLAREIGNSGGRVKGQAYTQTMLPSGDWRQRSGLSNDELILDCCKYFGHIKRKDVLLCTSDNNLAVQASANALNLFVRGISAVIRPQRGLWDSGQLLDRAILGFAKSTAASIHATGVSGGNPRQSHTSSSSSPVVATVITPIRYSIPSGDDVDMEVDVAETHTQLDGLVQNVSPKDRRDELHGRMVGRLRKHLRKLTGKAACLQQYRRVHESMYSLANAKFTGKLPTETEWDHAWDLRDCLRFVAKIPPPCWQRRSWIFGDGEASSLADFLGLPGEKGARPGREWAKHDWGRELLTFQRLARDFEFEDLDQHEMAEYEYAVMEAFSID